MTYQISFSSSFQITLIGFALLLSSCAGGTTVELANRSPQAVEHVSVKFTGGATPPQSIQPGGETTVRLNPTGESHLEIFYQSTSGTQTCLVDTYLEPEYRAAFRVELQESSCRVTHEEVELPYWLGAAHSRPLFYSFKPKPIRGSA